MNSLENKQEKKITQQKIAQQILSETTEYVKKLLVELRDILSISKKNRSLGQVKRSADLAHELRFYLEWEVEYWNAPFKPFWNTERGWKDNNFYLEHCSKQLSPDDLIRGLIAKSFWAQMKLEKGGIKSFMDWEYDNEGNYKPSKNL